MKNNPNNPRFGQKTRIFEKKDVYFHTKHTLWPLRPTPKGQIWPSEVGVAVTFTQIYIGSWFAPRCILLRD